jgi:RNA recognition motif-containing protein
LSKDTNFKPSAKSSNPGFAASPSPAPQDAEGDHAMDDGTSNEAKKLSPADIAARTITLLGIPDTVNDARVRALVEPLGTIVKLILVPGNRSAKIEFADAASAGKASLHFDGLDFEGNKLRIGSAQESSHGKAANTSINGIATTSKPKGLIPPPTNIRRPVLGKPGPRRGLGFAPAKKPAAPASAASGDSPATENAAGSNGKPAPKSNADFKAMFLAGKGGESKQNETGA